MAYSTNARRCSSCVSIISIGRTCEPCMARERERAVAKAVESDRQKLKRAIASLREKLERDLDWSTASAGGLTLSLHTSDPGQPEPVSVYTRYARMPPKPARHTSPLAIECECDSCADARRAAGVTKRIPDPLSPSPQTKNELLDMLSSELLLEVRLLGIDGVELSGGGYCRSYAKMQVRDGRLRNKHAVSFPVWTGGPTMVGWASFYQAGRHLCTCEQALRLASGLTLSFAAGAISLEVPETKEP